ncbi:hypothetical protein AK812_SmicGene33108 [Symbiodinium microadriaticum]|uniref:Reverse transcriptase domain-containing protein n=1 Tax=Symbiodinium microadriaticum TaxID=2951 RepID=A0A1Q9CSE5_SYMMI|nr:hypothetical protein AK812_SmicGene33108 [Symbiodinium microadriaticum]
MWKSARKLQQKEQKQWKKTAMKKIAEQDWSVKKVLVEISRDHSWELSLTERDDWKTTLRKHFEAIFNKQQQGEVAAKMHAILHRLSCLCKQTAWKPFTMEALKAILPHPIWRERLREIFNDMLYTARIEESIEAGATVRLARMAHDWGLEFYIAKLDIRKAFDSVFQESLAQHVSEVVGERGGQPWEVRAWVSLVHADKIAVQVAGESVPVQQSNGGSRKSCGFGCTGCQGWGEHMDDNYIWSTSRRHLQHLLKDLSERLPRQGLHLHPIKTDIIHNDEGKVTVEVAGQTVAAKGPHHIIHVLGSPLSFHGGTAGSLV